MIGCENVSVSVLRVYMKYLCVLDYGVLLLWSRFELYSHTETTMVKMVLPMLIANGHTNCNKTYTQIVDFARAHYFRFAFAPSLHENFSNYLMHAKRTMNRQIPWFHPASNNRICNTQDLRSPC